MPRKEAHHKKVVHSEDECILCGQEENPSYGQWHSMPEEKISAHYFCMLFSSGLAQNGEDGTGLGGFLVEDVKAEASRANRLKCTFCKQPRATIGCVVRKCKVMFHYPCGIANAVLNQYFDAFRSYCRDHRLQQSSPSDRLAFVGTAKSTCCICMTAVDARASHSTLRTPCCRNSWFHRECIQAQAKSAGLHFFRCPLCNNKDDYQQEMLQQGIYIPDQDAAWELENNAFRDLLERHRECNAAKCVCPYGRKYTNKQTKKPWAIVLCDFCGSQGSHLKCSGIDCADDDWVCAECTAIVGPMEKTSKKSKKSKMRLSTSVASPKSPHTPPVKPSSLPRKSQTSETPKSQMTPLSSKRRSDVKENLDCSVRLEPLRLNIRRRRERPAPETESSPLEEKNTNNVPDKPQVTPGGTCEIADERGLKRRRSMRFRSQRRPSGDTSSWLTDVLGAPICPERKRKRWAKQRRTDTVLPASSTITSPAGSSSIPEVISVDSSPSPSVVSPAKSNYTTNTLPSTPGKFSSAASTASTDVSSSPIHPWNDFPSLPPTPVLTQPSTPNKQEQSVLSDSHPAILNLLHNKTSSTPTTRLSQNSLAHSSPKPAPSKLNFDPGLGASEEIATPGNPSEEDDVIFVKAELPQFLCCKRCGKYKRITTKQPLAATFYESSS